MILPAYTFDPVEFHAMLESRIMVSGNLRTDLLLGMAKEFVLGASDTMLSALKNIRFDESWFDVSDPDISRVDECYMVVLTSILNQSSPLSNVSYGTLRH